MVWKEEFSVGIPVVDARYTRAGCIALVETAVTTRQRQSALRSDFVRPAGSTWMHSAIEENLMRLHRYAELERHVRDYFAFGDQINSRATTAMQHPLIAMAIINKIDEDIVKNYPFFQ